MAPLAKNLVYLDNCCFNRPYDDQSSTIVHMETEAKLDIQFFVKQGRLRLAWSFMLDYENSQNPFLVRRLEIQLWKDLASVRQEAQEAIRETAQEIVGAHNLGVKDAIHLACAIRLGCHWFATTDKQILQKSSKFQVEILSPIDFIRLYGEEYYDKSR